MVSCWEKEASSDDTLLPGDFACCQTWPLLDSAYIIDELRYVLSLQSRHPVRNFQLKAKYQLMVLVDSMLQELFSLPGRVVEKLSSERLQAPLSYCWSRLTYVEVEHGVEALELVELMLALPTEPAELSVVLEDTLYV
jgi:hypothetical protein